MLSMSSYGYTIELLPIINADEVKPLTPFRLLKEKGGSVLLPMENAGFVAYLEFPFNRKPRGNHFHKVKNECIYLAKGKLRGYFRPAEKK